MGIQARFSQTGKVFAHRHDAVFLKRFYDNLSQTPHPARVLPEHSTLKVLIHRPCGYIQYRRHIHVEAHQPHFHCRYPAKNGGHLVGTGAIADGAVTGKTGEGVPQPGHAPPFLIHRQKKGNAMVFQGRFLEIVRKCRHLKGINDIPFKQNNPAQAPVSNE